MIFKGYEWLFDFGGLISVDWCIKVETIMKTSRREVRAVLKDKNDVMNWCSKW